MPEVASFASIVCRLASLFEATDAAGALGSLRPKALGALGKAIDRTDAARDACAENDVTLARARLKQSFRQLVQYGHRLGSNSARRKVPAEVRTALAAEGEAIAADAKALRKTLACPLAGVD